MAIVFKTYSGRLATGGLLWMLASSVLGVDLPACVDIALKQNPDVLASQSQLAQAEAGLHQAQGQRLPKLSASLTGTRSNDALNAFGLKMSQRNVTFNDFGLSQYQGVGSVAPTAVNQPDPVTNYNPRLELLIPLYNGGMISGYVDQAHAYVKAAQEGNELARQQVIFHVIQAYQGVLTARAYVAVTQHAQAAAEAYVKTTQNLLTEGMVVRSDLLFAQVNLANVKVNLEEARRSEAAAMDQLHLLLGLPLDEKLEIGADYTPALLGGNIDALQDEAVATNPGLLAMRSQVDAAKAGVTVASADYYPHFNAMVRKDWNAPSFSQFASSYTVAGVLSWQLDMGVTRGAVGRAEASHAEIQAKLRQAEDGVRFQVIDAWRGSAEAESRLNARTDAVIQSEEAQRLVAKRYENGVTTMVEVLAAQAQLDKARAEQIAAQYQLTLQRSTLRLAVGKLNGDQL